jgi:hypothetical protein
MSDQRHPTREQVLDAIYHANDKATVREAQRLVRYWADDNPEDTEIPLAARRLTESAVALVSAHTQGADPQADVLMSLSDNAWQQFEAPSPEPQPTQWLTVAQAAKRLGISPRAVQKRCKSGSLTSHLDESTQPPKLKIDANSLPQMGAKFANMDAEKDANAASDGRETENETAWDGRERRLDHAQNRANLDANDSVMGREPDANHAEIVREPDANKDAANIQAVVGEVHQLRGEIENLKAFIAGGAMQALNERLSTLPDADSLRAMIVENQAQIVSVAVSQVAAVVREENAAKEAQTASKDDVRAILEQFQKLQDANARLSGELEQLRENKEKRGFFGRLFGG